jgi:hypothetical protein
VATGVGRMQGEVRMRSSSNSLVPRAKYIVQLKRLATYHPHPSVELSCSHYLSYLSRAMASPGGETPGELGIGEREAGWGLRAAPGEGQQPTRQKYGPG